MAAKKKTSYKLKVDSYGNPIPLKTFLENFKMGKIGVPDDAKVTIEIDGNAYNLLNIAMAVMVAGEREAPTPSNAIRAMAQALIDLEKV